MSTDLFVSASRVRSVIVDRYVPPACRRSVDEALVCRQGDTALVQTPTWIPGRNARHLVPSFSLLGDTPCSFRFELTALVGQAWTPWICTTTIGSHVFPSESRSAALTVEIDMFRAATPVEAVRLRVRVHPAGALVHPLLVTLSAADLDSPLPPEPEKSQGGVGPLAVPARSQMEEAIEVCDRICSPTSVAMVLEYWGHPTSVSRLAAEIFHPGLDRYGVWPAAMAAAARRGVGGYLLRFPDWAAVSWCLAQGLPVVASIRYESGELQGAAIARTDGHLVVLTGEDLPHVFVNDPAGRTRGEVARRYRRPDMYRVWLERGAVGYVFFPLDDEVLKPGP